MDIRCRKLDCKFNDATCCTRDGIKISNSTNCEHFEKDESKKGEPISKTMFEKKPKFAPFKHCGKFNINCSADCLFNCDGKCKANGITLLDEEKNAPCGTFFKKLDIKEN